MKLTNKEIQVLNKIIARCIDVENSIERFGDNYELFIKDYDYRNSVSMSMLQIGELIKHLSEDFRNEYPKVMWKEFAGMRDLFAHQYHKMDIEVIWNTAKNDVPEFKNYANNIIANERVSSSFNHIEEQMKYDISLDGLHTAFERFEKDGSCGVCGDWKVEKDLSSSSSLWSLSYAEEPIALCISEPEYDYIKRLDEKLSDKSFTEICEIARSVFPNCKMSADEQRLIEKRKQELK